MNYGYRTRRPRRTRYTVEYTPDNSNTVERVVVLALSAANADATIRNYWRNHGRYGLPLRVTKGDYRKATKPATGAAPNMLAIREACTQLGVELPVRVHTSMRQGGAYGHHILRKENGNLYHDIMVKGWLSVEQMGRTLWHELAHCVQSESFLDSSDPQRAWKVAYRDGTSYRMKRWERDAREHEDLNDDLPLAR